ncbi:hypothetical protein BHE90_009104 [Fusarium euwallaceae]|uniref:Protein kinase domain-containing protein n=1 Tax=Fusarium euwallaceae TaxID=1147111 RepID=A0A430LL19_9HYPO|nr:hypothetical protein BHE90_009104 [Fusarium euwallaceae]
MSGFEIVGVVGLLGSVKGAVETFNLLADLFASDTGLGHVALMYSLESIRFKVWCENVKADDKSACLLRKLPQEIQTCVANVMAEMVKIQETIKKHFVDKYKLPPLQQLPPGVTFSPKSSRIAQLRSQYAKLKLRHRWRWVTGKKQELEDLVKQIQKLNAHLDRLVPQTESDRARLVKAVLTQLDERLSLAAMFDPKGSEDSLLSLAFQIKTIHEQDPDAATAHVKYIHSREISVFCKPEVMDGRHTGIYSATGGHGDKVLVEWKAIKAGTPREKDIVTRIQVLGALLSTRDAEPFHRMPFVGIFDDTDFERRQGNRRIGLVYRIPKSLGNLNSPLSLAELIERDTKAKTRPALGDRFELASKLASAMSLFHATNWLHKSFRSDNILFGEDEDITKPYILGFGYSRPAGDDSIETHPAGDPKLDLYYHPDVSEGWTKIKDMYSLGIVLLEVALWRSMFEPRFQGMGLHQVSEDIVTSLNGQFGRDLVGMVGEVYVDVVKRCLAGCFEVQTGETREEAKELSNL